MHRAIENLETRRLLSGMYGKFDAAKGVLRIFGGETEDYVGIHVGIAENALRDEYQINIRFASFVGDPLKMVSYLPGELKQLRLYLGAGGDRVEVTHTSGRGYQYAVPTAVFAGSGGDYIQTGRGNDTIYGDGGNDRIYAGGGNDFVYAGKGNDRIWSGDTGRAHIEGGSGDDTLYNGKSRDYFDGGDGIDLVDYSARRDRLQIDLSYADTQRETTTGDEDRKRLRNNNLFDDGRATADETVENTLGKTPPAGGFPKVTPYAVPNAEDYFGTGHRERDSLVRVEQAIGGSRDDVLIGSSQSETLRGGDGDDLIFAGGGRDAVYGDDGDDYLFTVDTRDGMPGDREHPAADTVDGGAGTDFARFDSRDVRIGILNVENEEHFRDLST